jgi:hypothetical protein
VQKTLPAFWHPRATKNLGGRLVRKFSATVTNVRRKAAYASLFANAPEGAWLLHTAPYDEIALITETFAEAGKGTLGVVLRYDHYDVPAAIALVTRALAPARNAAIRVFSDSVGLQGRLQGRIFADADPFDAAAGGGGDR